MSKPIKKWYGHLYICPNIFFFSVLSFSNLLWFYIIRFSPKIWTSIIHKKYVYSDNEVKFDVVYMQSYHKFY